jgi:murein DD-endopeptidase MepM/ murein hydrolase activator NlpD
LAGACLSSVLAACAPSGPTIASHYGDPRQRDGRKRSAPHTGIDIYLPQGTPVLAAADGFVASIRMHWLCGTGLLLAHPRFGRYTAYCHLSKRSVEPGDTVKRGDILGEIGTTGYAGHHPHLHFEVCTRLPCGRLDHTEDPLQTIEGCFTPLRSYQTERFVLTYPVEC